MNTIEEQVLDCFPCGSYALSALLRLVDIVESDQVPTAAVECRIQPRLLINPDFVGRHANTPERLPDEFPNPHDPRFRNPGSRTAGHGSGILAGRSSEEPIETSH